MPRLSGGHFSFADPHPPDSSGEAGVSTAAAPPSIKEALRRRLHNNTNITHNKKAHGILLSSSGPCLSHEVGECNHCSSGGRVTTRLFAEPSCPPKAPLVIAEGSPGSPAEGTAGHVQARSRWGLSRQQQRPLAAEELAAVAACEAAARRCLYAFLRVLRLCCLILTPIILFLFMWGPTLYTRLPPTLRQLSLFAFPGLRVFIPLPFPARSHPLSLCTGTQPGFFEALFSLHKGEEAPLSRRTGAGAGELPTVDALRAEFGEFRERAIEAPPLLLQHKEEFKKGLVKVDEGVFVALGFGLANCIILEGTEGVVVVDTMESTETMSEVWKAWTDYNQGQGKQHVKGIIYTHFHTDHTFGAAAIYEEGITEVHAHVLTKIEMEKVLTVTAGTTYRRGMRQFGVYIHSNDFVHAGIGPALRYSKGSGIGTVLPTHLMRGKRKTVRLAGLEMELIHAPGESRDQVIVWIQKKRLLIGADNLYKSLPNIYAIRGTETRDCNDWVASLDFMRSLRPEVLLLGHTRPLRGEAHIYATLTAYRDAIQYIHDQTVRLMNKGMTLNDIAQTVQLPRHLREDPFLQPLYGTVPWAVRAVFTHYMGWFSGAAEELTQLSTDEKAEGLVSLAGGFKALLQKGLDALSERRFQWALEIATAAHTLQPQSEFARELRVIALRALASVQTAAPARNWYLTAALEVEGSTRLMLSESQKSQVLQRLSVGQIFSLLPVRVNPEAAEALNAVILFRFAPTPANKTNNQQEKTEPLASEAPIVQTIDIKEQRDRQESEEQLQCVHIRRGVVYTRNTCEREPDIVVRTTAAAWLRILTRETGPVAAAARGDIILKGSLMLLVRSLAAIELDVD